MLQTQIKKISIHYIQIYSLHIRKKNFFFFATTTKQSGTTLLQFYIIARKRE